MLQNAYTSDYCMTNGANHRFRENNPDGDWMLARVFSRTEDRRCEDRGTCEDRGSCACSRLHVVSLQNTLHGEVAHPRVLGKVALRPEFVFQHLGKVSHVLP